MAQWKAFVVLVYNFEALPFDGLPVVFPRGVVVGDIVVELMLALVAVLPCGVGPVDAVVEGVPDTVELWVLYVCGVVVGDIVVELLLVLVVVVPGGGEPVDAVVEGVVDTVERWVVCGCGQGSVVSFNPGFGVLMFCEAWAGKGPIPISSLVDQEFWRFWSE